MTPRVRAGLIARTVADEVVVYDPSTHQAHCLNRTAAIVFEAADGTASVAALAASLSRHAGGDVGEDVVWTALEQLAAAGLLQDALEPRGSRRQALRRVGAGLAALAPVVVSLVVPTPAEALNTCIPATACTTSSFGQPCYVLSQAECATKACTGAAGDCQ